MVDPQSSTVNNLKSRRSFLQQLTLLGVSSPLLVRPHGAIAAVDSEQAAAGKTESNTNIPDPTLEFVFQLTLDVAEIIRFGSAGNLNRGFANVQGGTIDGPRLSGKAIPNTGGDYPYFRSDGVIEFEATYLLEATDGTPILIKNKGYRHGPKAVLDALRAREEVDPSSYYMRLAPTFEVAAGPHDWLTKNVLVGTGHRDRELLMLRYFMVN